MKRGKSIIRIKTKNCSLKREFVLSNVNFYQFCSEGTDERARVIEFLNKGLYGDLLFESLSYEESTT